MFLVNNSLTFKKSDKNNKWLKQNKISMPMVLNWRLLTLLILRYILV